MSIFSKVGIHFLLLVSLLGGRYNKTLGTFRIFMDSICSMYHAISTTK